MGLESFEVCPEFVTGMPPEFVQVLLGLVKTVVAVLQLDISGI